MINVLKLYSLIVKPESECSHYVWKKSVDFCFLAWLLIILNKNSFESSAACLSTSNTTNKAEVCALLFAETSK